MYTFCAVPLKLDWCMFNGFVIKFIEDLTASARTVVETKPPVKQGHITQYTCFFQSAAMTLSSPVSEKESQNKSAPMRTRDDQLKHAVDQQFTAEKKVDSGVSARSTIYRVKGRPGAKDYTGTSALEWIILRHN